ncbi:MAG: flagellar export protein FliJ, partial [Clostridiales bacterium]|nr:flagellar export protein FliJ [Clostridiales bacterium]
MAKFVYRMQNILNIKLKMENQERIAFGIANAKLREEQEKLQQILLRRAGYERKAVELVKGSLNIQDIKECKRAIDTLKSQQRTHMMNVHTAEKNVELARERLNEVMIERKTHEKLREKAFEDFKKEL